MRELADIELSERDGVTLASVSGEIDLSNVGTALEALRDAMQGPRGLVVDLTRLEYLDSTGVRLLFRIEREAAESGRRLRTVVPEGSSVRRVLELAQLGDALPLDDTVEAALAALATG
jgi:anti-sigma B factor antagonist